MSGEIWIVTKMESFMQLYDYQYYLYLLILPTFFLLTAGIFVVLGYWMGRKTITDTPLIEKRFDPDDKKEPEQSEIQRCLYGDE